MSASSFNIKQWQQKLTEATQEGWKIDYTTGSLLDDDDDYSYDSQDRREQYRDEVSEMLRDIPTASSVVQPAASSSSSSSLALVVPMHTASDDDDDNDDDENEEESPPKKRTRGNFDEPPAFCSVVDTVEEYELSSFVFLDVIADEVFTADWVARAMIKAKERWCPQPDDTRNYAHPVQVASRRFQLEWDGVSMPPNIDKTTLMRNYKAEISAVYEMISRACQAGLYTDMFRSDATRVLYSVHYSFQMLHGLYNATSAWKVGFHSPADPCVSAFKPLDYANADITDYQHLVIYLLNKIFECRLRRHNNEWLCSRVFNDDNVFVHTYTPTMTIGDFVSKQISMHDRFELWQAYCKDGSTRTNLIRYLSQCDEPQMPDLKKDRYVHSFRNGLYFVLSDTFVKWNDRPIPSETVACKYHPVDFEHFLDYTAVDFVGNDDHSAPAYPTTAFDIPTPSLEKIMLDQGWDYQTRLWNYALLGRMLYWAREKDRWQVWPFYFGLANTGKSTMCQIFEKYFYDSVDVSSISNTFEKTFGLWSICDSFGVYSSEVGEDFKMDRTELQQIISAETVTIRAKNQKALPSFDWRSHGMMAGNHIPAWNDPQGAMVRRLLIFMFSKRVQVDGSLLGRIGGEIANLILKCNRIYRAAVEHVGDRSVWEALPQSFHTNRRRLQSEVSPLHGFLMSGEVELRFTSTGEPDPSVYVPISVLKERFRSWCKENNITGGRWNQELYSKALRDNKLDDPVKCRRAYPRDLSDLSQQLFVFGIDMTDEVRRVDGI